MSLRTMGLPSLKAKKIAWKLKREKREKRIPARVKYRARIRSSNKYTPHQGVQECARRAAR